MTVSTSTTTAGNGKVRTAVATTEVTQLSTRNVYATLFDIPAGYGIVDLTVPQSATASAQPDSAHPADSAASKSSLVKKGLKGLFGRPQ